MVTAGRRRTAASARHGDLARPTRRPAGERSPRTDGSVSAARYRRRVLSVARLLCALAVAAVWAAAPASAAELSLSLEPSATRLDADRIARGLGGRVVDAIPQLHAYLVEVPDGFRAGPALRRLGADPRVRSARPDAQNRLSWDIDDTYADRMPHLAEIGVSEAWDVTRGDPGVTIAIVDSGVQLDHPDLVGRVVAGADVANEDDDPTDTIGHGTFVAGIAGAA